VRTEHRVGARWIIRAQCSAGIVRVDEGLVAKRAVARRLAGTGFNSPYCAYEQHIPLAASRFELLGISRLHRWFSGALMPLFWLVHEIDGERRVRS
jgi:hypothetical protein